MSSLEITIISFLTWSTFLDLTICQQQVQDLGAAVKKLEQEAESLIQESNAIGTRLASLSQLVSDNGIVGKIIPKSAEVSDVMATDERGNEFSIDLSYDGSIEAEYGDCFYSEHKSNSWVKYNIARSKVHFVEVLPRPYDVAASKKLRIQVCNGQECTECGLVGEIQPYKFETVQCTGDGSGITGNVVKVDIINQEAWLTICEIEIFGQVL